MIPVLVMVGIAHGVSYWICSTGIPVWRAISGFLIGFFAGWLIGGGIAVLVLTTVFDADAATTTFSLLKNGIAWALFGSGLGVFRARKKLRNIPVAEFQDTPQIGGELDTAQTKEFQSPFADTTPEPPPERIPTVAPKVFTFRNEHENTEQKPAPTKPPIGKSTSVALAPPVGHVPDEAFAEAMTEIEESRTVKGLWARCFAETGGDEVRTKAAYLSKRAEALATEINHRLFVEAQAKQRSKEYSALMTGVDAVNPSALFKLGMQFRTQNELTEPDEDKAIACIAKAAFLGHTEAQNQLSMMYWNGDGVTQSKRDALAWCRCAGVNNVSYWERASQWMMEIDSPEVRQSDEIVASIVAVKNNPNTLEGAITALKARNLSLVNTGGAF